MSDSPRMSSRYKWLQKLGQGQGETVCKYRDIKADTAVAIKRIDPSTVDAGVMNKTLRALEAKPHEHIVSLLRGFPDSVEGASYYFVVFEFAPGGTLDSKGPLSMAFVRSIMRQVVSGVDHMHNVLNCVHRDIKLENIVFKDAKKTKVVICDLGLALPADLDKDLKKIFFASRTREYVSYEVWEEQRTGKPQDIWSLGVLTYKLLCKSFPFQYITMTEVKEIVDREMKDEAAVDLLREKNNPITKTADIVTQDALNKIKKGIDWPSFPKGPKYAVARDFIKNLLLLDYNKRYTAKKAMMHKFLYSSVKPSVGRTETPRSRVFGPAAAAAKKPTQAGRQNSSSSNIPVPLSQITSSTPESSTRSEDASKSGTQLRLRGGGEGDSDVEDLTPWQRKSMELNRSNWRVKMLFLLSVRAGYSIVDGMVLIPRMMAEIASLRRKRPPTIVEAPEPGPNLPRHVVSPASTPAREQTPPPPAPTGPAPDPASAPTPAHTRTPSTRNPSPPANTDTPSPPPQTHTSSSDAHTPPPASTPSPPSSLPARPAPSQIPLPSSIAASSTAGSIDLHNGRQATVDSESDSAFRSGSASPTSDLIRSVAGGSDAGSVTGNHREESKSKQTSSKPASVKSGHSDVPSRRTDGSVASSQRPSGLPVRTPSVMSKQSVSTAGSHHSHRRRSSKDAAGGVNEHADPRDDKGKGRDRNSSTPNTKKNGSAASSRRSSVQSTAPSASRRPSWGRRGTSDGGHKGKGKGKAGEHSVVASDVKRRGSVAGSAHAGPMNGKGKGKAREGKVVAFDVKHRGPAAGSAHLGHTDDKDIGKGKAKEQSGAGAGAEQGGQPGPSEPPSHDKKHLRQFKHVKTSAPQVTKFSRVPPGKIQKAIENSQKPLDQQSISTTYGSVRGSSRASSTNGDEEEQE